MTTQNIRLPAHIPARYAACVTTHLAESREIVSGDSPDFKTYLQRSRAAVIAAARAMPRGYWTASDLIATLPHGMLKEQSVRNHLQRIAEDGIIEMKRDGRLVTFRAKKGTP